MIYLTNKRNISYGAIHYPIRTYIRKSCKNCSETKLYITKKLQFLFIFAIYAKYIYVLIILKVLKLTNMLNFTYQGLI